LREAFPGPDDGPKVEVTPRARVRLDDLEAIAEAAEAGHGLAWLPRWLVRCRAAPQARPERSLFSRDLPMLVLGAVAAVTGALAALSPRRI